MKSLSIKVPGVGLFGLVYDKQGEAQWFPGGLAYQTHLMARHLDKDGKLVKEHDCGSGVIPFATVLSLALDYQYPSVSAAKVSTLTLANNHISGTGATAAATTDIKIQTGATVLASTLPQAGVQSITWAATNTNTSTLFNSVATLTYNGSAAITEWALMTGVQNAITPPTTGTPLTSTTPGTVSTVMATGTATGTPYTASSTTVRGQALTIFECSAATTPFWGIVANNTTGVVTVPAWYATATGVQATVAGTLSLAIRDLMFDRKVFSAINVVSGDSIQFTYNLTITAGG